MSARESITLRVEDKEPDVAVAKLVERAGYAGFYNFVAIRVWPVTTNTGTTVGESWFAEGSATG